MRARIRLACVVVLSNVLASPALGQTPFQHQGLDPLHPPDSAMPNEQVDPASGTLTVVATDLVLPGNAGFNLAITRVYNSSIFPDYSSGSTALEERSWAGVGWRLHFGRILHADSQSAGQIVIEMGDGSRHPLYHSQANPNIWTTSDFWLYNPATNVLQLPNGMVYTFGRAVTINDRFGLVRYVTAIQDPFGNTITFSYFDGTSGPIDGVQSIHQVLSATEARDVTFTVDSTLHALASMTYLNHTWTYTEYGTGPDGNPLLVKVQPPQGPPTVYDYGGAALNGEMNRINAPWGGAIDYTYQDATRIASTYSTTTRVVASRRMSGHDIYTPGTWTFAYSQGPNHDSTVVSCPCGGTTTYRFNGTGQTGSFEAWRAGTVAEITVQDGTTTLEDRTMDWIASDPISPDPVFGPNGIWSDDAVHRPLLNNQVIARGGRSFTTSHTYHWGQGTFNDYAQPWYTEESRSDTPYQWRHTTREFQNGFTPYIVGRLASVWVTENSAYGVSDGTVSSTFAYNLSTGFLTSQTVRGVTTSFTARSDGNVGTITDANNHVTTFGYDWGVVSDIQRPSTHTAFWITPEGLVGSQTQVGDQSTGNVTTNYGYDLALRLTTITPPVGNPTTFYPDDLHGTYVRVVRGGSTIEHDMDAFGREIRALNSQGLRRDLGWDLCGHQTFDGDPYTNLPAPGQGRTMTYDALGRVTQVQDAAGKVTTFVYGGLTDVGRTDANGHYTLTEGMGFGDPATVRPWRVWDPSGHVTLYAYDVTGAIRQVHGPGQPPDAADGPTRAWAVSNGLVTSSTQPESGTTTYTYDAVGNLHTVTDANNQQTTFTYDADNRLTARDAPGTDDDLTIAYDALGRTRTLAGGGTTTTFTYDVTNRRVTRQDATAVGTFSSTYTTDANDNLQQIQYPSGRLVTYHYDAENRLLSLDHTPPGAPSSSPFAQSFTYADGGQLASYVTGLVTHNFTYEFSRPKRLFTTGGAQALDLTYAYDDVGNVLQIADPRTNATQNFVTDPLDRLTQATGPWGTLSWSYDAAGNRLNETTAAGTTTYTYNASTQRLTSTSGAANETFTYDNVGRLTSDGVVSQYTYTPTGKLKTATNPSITANYVYDAAGERFAKTVNGRTMYSIRGGSGEVLSEYLDSCGSVTWARDLVYAGGQLIGAAKAAMTQPTVAVVSEPLSFSESAGQATMHVALTTPDGAALPCPVVVNYATTAGTAMPASDYTATTGTLTFLAGAASGSTLAINVPIVNDTRNEDNETFTVGLTSVTGAAISGSEMGTITIVDDDPLPSLSIGDVSQVEGDVGTNNFVFTVALSAASGRTVTVNYATANGTATAGSDYGAVSGTLTFPAGTTTATITVPVTGDYALEADETFTVQISNPVNATMTRWIATGTIVNDDSDNPPRHTWGDLYTPHDGAADASLFNTSTFMWTFKDSNSGALQTFGPFGDAASGDIFVPADYNGDGRTDCAYYRPSTGEWRIAPSCILANAYSVFWGGDPSDVPVPADFDGDGKADLVVYRRATNIWYIAYSTGGSGSTEFGWNWTMSHPVPGDYDGDGKADLAYYAEANSSWWIIPSSGVAGVWVTDGTLGGASVIVTPGDFDGDGRMDTAYYYPATGGWYIVLAASRISSDNGGTGTWTYFGNSSSIPVSADYDGDGKTDIAIWDPVSQIFWVIRTSTGQEVAIYLQGVGTVPILKRPQ